MVTVREAMTSEVFALTERNLIHELIDLMSQRGIGSVVIVDEQKVPVQIFTLRDIPKMFTIPLETNQIQELIIKLRKNERPLVTIRQNQSLVTALNLMNRHEISHLPVVDNDKKLVGILSMRDLIRHFPSIVFTDSLTKVNNRMYLDMIRSKIERSRGNLCLMMIDIDNFKTINDTYGHSFGDMVLKRVAESIRSSIKSHDEAIRFGGEEFLVILYRCDINSVEAVGNRIRERVKSIKFPDNQSLVVTVSIGCTSLVQDERLQRAIERADEALYRAKREGKDRVVCL